MGYTPISDLITEVLKIKERVEKNAKWQKYDKKLICKINENNLNSGISTKKVGFDEKSNPNNKRNDNCHEDIDNGTNGHVQDTKSTNQYVEYNKDVDASANITVHKPTYASIAKKGAKINNFVHKLN